MTSGCEYDMLTECEATAQEADAISDIDFEDDDDEEMNGGEGADEEDDNEAPPLKKVKT